MKKKFILILLAAMMICSFGNTNVFAKNDAKKITNGQVKDYAPVIGEFHYDSDYAAKITEKEHKAKAYYKAKMSGNTELANSMLNELKTTYDKARPDNSFTPLASGKRFLVRLCSDKKSFGLRGYK